MLRQIEKLVLASLLALLAIGLLAGFVREGFLLGLVVLAVLVMIFIPKAMQSLFRTLGTLFVLGVLLCFLHSSVTSLASDPSDASTSLALLVLSLGAYLFRKFRQPRIAYRPRTAGAERTPVLPSSSQEAE